jgi:hypothetical protein
MIMEIAVEELRFWAIISKFQLTTGRNRPKARVLVNGSPKSGTIWMLRMISTIPGYRAVGNFRGNIDRYYQIQYGDVVHGHDWYTPELREILFSQRLQVILMIRDPRDQLVSRMFHVKRSPEHSWHERFKSSSVDEALMLCIEGRDGLPGTDSMIKLARTWLDQKSGFLCIRYEDLWANPVGEFGRVLAYLGIEGNVSLAEVIVNRNRFERLSIGRRFWQPMRKPGQEDASSHFRKGMVGDWRNYLQESHIRRFKEIAGEELISLGYERDMDW